MSTNTTSSAARGNLFDQMALAGRLLFDGRVPFNLKLMLPIAAILYWLWPIDLMPGLPFDDMAVLFVAMTLFIQLANQAVAKQVNPQSGSANRSAGGSDASANPSSEPNVVDTTWRVIE